MKYKVLGIGVLILVSIVTFVYLKQDKNADSTLQHPGWMDQYLELKGDENGKIPAGMHAKWYAADQANTALYKKAENNLENITEVGPDNVGGRNRSIIIDRFNANRFLCAGVSGGIWVSENKGASWAIVDNNAPTLSATCITQSPFDKDVFYYGTGEAFGNSADLGGLGLFRSRDGAKTFEHLTHTATNALNGIWDVEHSLTLDSTIYAATHTSGVWRSTDGGATFSRVSQMPSGRVNEIKATDDGYIMAAFDAYGIVKMKEDDLSVQRLNGAGWPTSGYGRISFSYAKQSPQVMFAQLAVGSGDALQGIYKTSNGGLSWTKMSSPTFISYTQAWYDFILTVAPADTNFVVTAAVAPAYSTDGGQTWKEMANSHSDYHELTWESNTSLLVGNDGGVYRMDKNNMSTFTTLNNGLNITQFYAGHFYPTGTSLIGGTQDNGTRYSQSGAATMPSIWGGDGSFCAVNQQNSAVRYVSSQYLNLWRTGTGNSNIGRTIRTAVGGDDGVWFINPIEINNLDGDQLYVPTRREIFRSVDAGASWIKLTTDLVGDSYAIGLSNEINPTAYIGGTASRLYRVDKAATAPEASEISMWTTKYPLFLGSTIGCIEVDPNDASVIYCGLTNVNPKSRLWRIKDANTAEPVWEDISGNLPSSLPVNWIEVDPEMSAHIIIATDYGLYSTLNGGLSWNKEMRIPNVPIDQIRLRHSDRKLFIFTHGRGIWTADLKNNLVAKTQTITTQEFSVYPNPSSDYIKLVGANNSSGNLYNLKGDLVAKSANNQIDVRELSAGTYFVEIQSNQKRIVKKVIVTH